MRNALLAALAAVPLSIAGCAYHKAEAPRQQQQAQQASAAPSHPEQISPAHPYCLFVPQAGQLRECYQFAFGRCTAWGSQCPTPGFMTPGAAASPGTGQSSGAYTDP